FDAEADKDDAEVDADARELAELAAGLDAEETVMQDRTVEEGGAEDGVEDDPDDEVDAMEGMTDEERAQFVEDVRPIKLVLAKLRKLTFKIINSSTLLLPAWKKILKDLNLPEKMLPRDVKTRWNSTYDMASECLKYRAAIDRLCADQANGL
ncbi:hypothetical protein K466DRAFT_453724, partial [Polyporus arcularius HHB13444]